MTNKVDFSEWNPDRLETDDEDLIRTIYAYFCNAGYPHRLQDGIDTTIKILSTMDNSYLEMVNMVMEMAGAVDMWGFRQGFKAAIELLSGNTFQQIFKEVDNNGK